MQTEFTLEQKRALALASARKRKAEAQAQAQGSFATPEAALDALGRDPGQSAAQTPQPQTGNGLSRAFGSIADARIFPGPAGSIISGGARAAQAVAERPFQTLVVDPLTSPQRAVSGFIGASEDLARGNFKAAGRQALQGATAAGETALLLAPGASVAKSAALSGPVARRAGPAILDDFAKSQIDPTLPVVAPQTAGRIAKPLSENFAGGITIRGQADKIAGQTERAVERTADAFSDAGITDAGQAAISGVKGQLRKRPPNQRAASSFQTFREKSATIYDDAFSKIDTKAKAQPSATKQTLAEINESFDNVDLQELFALPKTAKLDEILNSVDGLTINDLRKMRTSIRELQNQGRLIKTVDEAALERLESSLTQDIFDGIKATSGDAAANRLRVADRFYRKNITSIRLALKPFLKEGVTQEDAFRSIVSASRGKGRGDIRQLRALRRALTPQQMDDVSAGIIRQMGKAKDGGEFSPQVFARSWADMSDEAKATLFNRSQRPEVRENLDALARVIERQANVENLTNRSQSGAVAQNIGTGVAFLSNPMATGAAIVGANAFGRLLMSPSFTRFLLNAQTQSARIANAGVMTARDKGRALLAITAAENSDPAIKPYTQELRAALEADNDNLLKQQRNAAK